MNTIKLKRFFYYVVVKDMQKKYAHSVLTSFTTTVWLVWLHILLK